MTQTEAPERTHRHPNLFSEGLHLSPGQESVLVALDYLGAVPSDPQNGRPTIDIARQAGMTPHVARARLVELRQAGLVGSGDCPQHDGQPLADAETHHAHFLTIEGHLRSRWAVKGRRADTNGHIGDQERRLLAHLYLSAAVPSDRLAQERRALAWIGATYRERTEQKVSDAELVRHIIRCRKQGEWPRVGRSPRAAFQSATEDLPKRERRILFRVYSDLGHSCDATLTSEWHGRSLARAFEEASGIRRPARLLIDTLMTARKSGDLPRLRNGHDHGPG